MLCQFSIFIGSWFWIGILYTYFNFKILFFISNLFALLCISLFVDAFSDFRFSSSPCCSICNEIFLLNECWDVNLHDDYPENFCCSCASCMHTKLLLRYRSSHSERIDAEYAFSYWRWHILQLKLFHSNCTRTFPLLGNGPPELDSECAL